MLAIHSIIHPEQSVCARASMWRTCAIAYRTQYFKIGNFQQLAGASSHFVWSVAFEIWFEPTSLCRATAISGAHNTRTLKTDSPITSEAKTHQPLNLIACKWNFRYRLKLYVCVCVFPWSFSRQEIGWAILPISTISTQTFCVHTFNFITCMCGPRQIAQLL